jgi:hypothetical protein
MKVMSRKTKDFMSTNLSLIPIIGMTKLNNKKLIKGFNPDIFPVAEC